MTGLRKKKIPLLAKSIPAYFVYLVSFVVILIVLLFDAIVKSSL